MPNEPDQDKDQALRAYAEQRRAQAGAPGELHPVNRRLLQAEVARVHGRDSAPAKPRANWFAGLWPRLAAASVFIVAGVFAFRFVQEDGAPESRGARIADSERAGAAATPAETELFAATAPADERQLLAEKESLNMRDASELLRRSAGTRQDMLAADERKLSEAATPATRRQVGMAGAAVPAPASVPAPRSAAKPIADAPLAKSAQVFKQKADGFAGGVANETRARFVKLAAATGDAADAKSAATTSTGATVLDRFTIEQSGRELRFLDADGSVYTGAVEFAVSAPQSSEDFIAGKNVAGTQLEELSQRTTLARAIVPSNSVTATQWNFNAYGINRTLQQPVIVNGSLEGTFASGTNTFAPTLYGIAAQNAVQSRTQPTDAATAVQSKALLYDAKDKAANAPGDAYQFNSNYSQRLNPTRIQGKVRVGTNSPLQNLDAVPDTK